MFAAIAAASAAFAAPMLIPAPREMSVTGGRVALVAADAPKVEVVASIPPEGYELSITGNAVTIRHSDGAGLFYAKATLAQLRADATDATLPCLEIKDAPAFRWRGVMLDEGRHFFGKAVVRKLLERMAQYKFNVFHWHLTDNEGWRIEIPEFPELTKRGNRREGRCESEVPLFYTERDIKEMLDFAKARHITVVPEIDFPGHFGAALRAYPHLACGTGRKNVMCLGNPEAVALAEKVLDRVCELFPGEVVHIGGDECPVSNWAKCPKCRALMEREGIGDLHGLQPWLTRRLAAHLKTKGRRMTGWDEIAVGPKKRGKAAIVSPTVDLPPDVLVMGRWQDAEAAIAASGRDVVRCTYRYCYFDYPQGLAEDPFPYFCKIQTPLAKTYAYDPLADVPPEHRSRVLGGECCSWTEKTVNPTMLEWKMWPRTLALAEVLWSYPDPANRDFKEFCERAAAHRRRLIRNHVNCAPLK